MAYNDSSYGLFQGQLFIAERGYNGAFLSGFEFLGDVDQFRLMPKQAFDDIKESQTGGGYTAAHILTGTEVGISLRALDMKLPNWIRATWGGSATAVASGSVTGESVKLYNGRMTPLAHPGVSSVVITSTPSLVLGTDYTVDAANGTISILPTSTAIVDGTPITASVAYTRAAYNGRVEAFITGQRYYSLRLHGRNTAQNNQPVIVNCRQAVFDMAKTLSLIEKTHQAFEMDGMLLQDTTLPLPQVATDLSQFFNVIKA